MVYRRTAGRTEMRGQDGARQAGEGCASMKYEVLRINGSAEFSAPVLLPALAWRQLPVRLLRASIPRQNRTAEFDSHTGEASKAL